MSRLHALLQASGTAGLLLLVGCPQQVLPASSPAAAGAPAGPPTVVFRSETGAPAMRISDSALLIESTWPQPEPSDWQVVELITPTGDVFERTKVPVGADGQSISRVPLRGSYIEDYSMTGTWTVRIYRNAASVPVYQDTFVIQP